jgi:hypothetical protein
MLLDEALSNHDRPVRERETQVDDKPDISWRAPSPGTAYDDLRSAPVDFGTNDTSWDDSSSSGGGDSW